MAVTVTPCTSTVTETATATATSSVDVFPLKRHVVEVRVETECIATTNSPTSLPAYATTRCTAYPTVDPISRLSSACSCNGVTASTITLPSPVTTVTTTTTSTATVTPTPDAFVLESSGDASLWVSVDGEGALVLIRDRTAATPFYVDHAGQLRNLNSPDKLIVDYYRPHPGTADNQVFNAVPGSDNFEITCNSHGSTDGSFWGVCQASGPPNGNPVVYGFGTCPNEGAYVYMFPNNSNVKCFDGGYAFIGFWLRKYTPVSGY